MKNNITIYITKNTATRLLAICALVAVSLTLLSQCNSKKTSSSTEAPEVTSPAVILSKHSFSEPHLGTMARIVFYSDHDQEQASQLAKKCYQRINALDAVFSDYRDDSELNKLCQKPLGKAHAVSDELFTVIAYAQTISAKTNGAFDITLGKHTQRWRERSSQQQDQINYRHLVLDSEKKTITLLKPLKLDLGGIAKGYIADQLMSILKDAGMNHSAVVIGGETVLADAPPGKKGWSIGVENPEKKLIGKLILANTALSTSGDSYQYFEADGNRHSHLIEPDTKKSKMNRLNVTVIAPTAMQADGFATALRILSTENAQLLATQEPSIEAMFIPYKKESLRTSNFPALREFKLKVK